MMKGVVERALIRVGQEEAAYQETIGHCTKKGEDDGANPEDGCLCG